MTTAMLSGAPTADQPYPAAAAATLVLHSRRRWTLVKSQEPSLSQGEIQLVIDQVNAVVPDDLLCADKELAAVRAGALATVQGRGMPRDQRQQFLSGAIGLAVDALGVHRSPEQPVRRRRIIAALPVGRFSDDERRLAERAVNRGMTGVGTDSTESVVIQMVRASLEVTRDLPFAVRRDRADDVAVRAAKRAPEPSQLAPVGPSPLRRALAVLGIHP